MRKSSSKVERGWFTKRDLAEVLNVTEHQFWRRFQQITPAEAVKQIDGRTYFHGRSVLDAWLRDELRKATPTAAESDELLAAGGDSPGLERYRNAKADLAEMERDKLKGNLIPREQIEPVWVRIGLIFRRAGQALQRAFGNDASTILNDALVEADSAAEQMLSVSGDGFTDPERVSEDDGGGENAAPAKHEGVRGAGDRPADRTLRGPTVQMRSVAV